MICVVVVNNWIDECVVVLELLIGIWCVGVDIVFIYWVVDVVGWFM